MVKVVLDVRGNEVVEYYKNWNDFNNKSIYLAKEYGRYSVVSIEEV